MQNFETSSDHETFRISQRYRPEGRLSYNFSWLNGLARGTDGFTVGRSGGEASSTAPESALSMYREELVESARSFLDSFYAAGGIGEEDFPDHVPARELGNSSESMFQRRSALRRGVQKAPRILRTRSPQRKPHRTPPVKLSLAEATIRNEILQIPAETGLEVDYFVGGI